MKNISNPILEGKPIALGDFLCYNPGGAQALAAITSEGTMVKGWSPCLKFVYLGWAGVVPLADCTWADAEKIAPVQRLYKAPTANQWDQAVRWGLIRDAKVRGIKTASDQARTNL